MKFSSPGPLLATALLVFLSYGSAGLAWGQELTFNFEVTMADADAMSHTFGLRDDAKPGFDIYDVPAPPPPPDSVLNTYLAMFSPPPDLPNQWLEDYRPVAGLVSDRLEIWQMELTAAVSGLCTITISTPQANLAPYKLSFFGPGVDFQEIVVPGSFSFPLSSSFLVFFWELRLADEVDVTTTTWGGVKSLYH